MSKDKDVEVEVEETLTEEQAVDSSETENKDVEVEVEMISKEEAAKEAQKMVDKALARKLPSKEEMEQFKNWKDSQKTETEKQAEILEGLKKLEGEVATKSQENFLLKQGVSDVDYVMFKVSKMEGQFEDNVAEFLKDNPKYLKADEPLKTTGTSTKGVPTPKEDSVVSILKDKYPDLF